VTLLIAGLGLSLATNDAAETRSAQSVQGRSHFRQVALVFEVSQGSKGVVEVLDVLERLGVTATFFFTGRWADQHPAVAQSIARGGHAIGNGAWSRKNLNHLADWEVEREALQADDRFVSRFSRNYVPLFRSPLERANPRVRTLIRALGFTVVHCTFDSLGRASPSADASMIERHILQHSDAQLDGASILLHAGLPQTAKALPAVIRSLWGRGFEFVSLAEWMGPSAGNSEPPVLSDAGN
jgi:peptidoglycan/xylan/chitin deacetylase (PgdA/CDA1 family)